MGKLILDVSTYDRGIDLASWKSKRGLCGVIVKCGGSDQGQYEDSCFETHIANAIKLGLPVGVYYYSAAMSVAEAKSDAGHCLRILNERNLDMPVYMDVEERSQLNLSESELTPVVEEFCSAIESGGYRAGIYSNTEGFLHMSDSVCRYSLWLAYWAGSRPSWASKNRGYELWQQGSMNLSTGIVAYDDVRGNVDCNWTIDGMPSGKRVEVDMGLRERIVSLARRQIGTSYYSMNYNWKDGWGGMGTHYVGRGCGCAQLVSMLFNTTLGTRYVGSCWNFAGDCFGDRDINQGGGEFEWVDAKDTVIGDIVLYCQSGYTGADAEDYGHTAILVGNGMVVGAMGQGVPGQSGYLNIGVSETTIAAQSLGGKIRYARCKRLDAKPVEKKEPEPVKEQTEFNAKLWKSTNSEAQQWNLHKVDESHVMFYNPHRGGWLVVNGDNTKGTPVCVSKCGKEHATIWELRKVEAPWMRGYRLLSGGFALDCVDGGTEIKTGLRLWKDNGTPAQLWLLCDSGDGRFRIISTKSGLAIDCGIGVE